MATVTIPVPEGITTHQGILHEIVLREPTFGDLLELGEPVAYSQTPGGGYFASDVPSVVRAYFERCLVSPKDPLVVETISLKTGREVKQRLLSFFRQESSAAEPSKTSDETSSGRPTSSAPSTSSE